MYLKKPDTALYSVSYRVDCTVLIATRTGLTVAPME